MLDYDKNLTGRLPGWLLQLQECDIRVVYMQGRKRLDADCLSRYPEGWGEVRTDIEGSHGSPRSPAHPLTINLPAHDDPRAHTIAAISLQNIIDLQQEDPSLKKVQERLQDSPSFEVVEDVLYKRNFSGRGEDRLLVLPKPLRREALFAAHADPRGGHQGIAKTFGKISQKYYWPRAYADSETPVRDSRRKYSAAEVNKTVTVLHCTIHGVVATTTFDTAFPPSPATSTFSLMVHMEKLRECMEEARRLARDLADRAMDDNKSEYDERRTGSR